MVRKSDGSQEAFDIRKLRRSLASAMEACRYDVRFADSLSQAVLIHLRDWKESRPPSTEYIFRCIRQVLMETGLEDVAHQLTIHRRHRSMRRRSIAVIDPDNRERPRPWRKATVCSVLQQVYGLSSNVSRILAGEIESRVVALNYGAVSKALVEELIRNELLAWGLAGDPLSDKPVFAERFASSQAADGEGASVGGGSNESSEARGQNPE
jgi:hypothetical protein